MINWRSLVTRFCKEFSSFGCSLEGNNSQMFGRNEFTADKVHNGSEVGEIIDNREDTTERDSKRCKQVHQKKSNEELTYLHPTIKNVGLYLMTEACILGNSNSVKNLEDSKMSFYQDQVSA